MRRADQNKHGEANIELTSGHDTRVAGLYNNPMNQVNDELINNRDFGLLHNADLKQLIHTR